MELPRVNSSGEIIQDVTVTGRKYVGVSTPTLGSFSTGSNCKYGFILYNRLQGNAFEFIDQFTLPFPPDSISEDEPASVNVTYTQGAGRWVERKGQLSKVITLSGTTGFNYNPKLPPVARRFLTQHYIVEKEGPESGMGKFLKLRNFFRSYWAIFSDDNYKDQRSNLFMAFLNDKDDEAWIVEPLNFRMDRSSPRNKFTYNYNISLQTIAPLDGAFFIEDPLTLFKRVANAATMLDNYVSEITRMASSFGQALAFVGGALATVRDAIVNTAQLIVNACTSVIRGGASLWEVRKLLQGKTDVSPMPDLDTASWMTLLFKFITVARQEEDITGADPVPYDAWRELSELTRLVAVLSARLELMGTEFSAQWASLVARFSLNYGFGGYDRNMAEAGRYTGVRETTIQPGQDLVMIAARELGDPERFAEIVVLNNLRPPYISADAENRLPNTLAPGDPILLPTPGAGPSARAPIEATVYTDPTTTQAVASSTSTITTVATAADAWRDNQWVGFTAEVISGAGAGQTQKIASNTGNTFTVAQAWDTLPGATSVIRIKLVRVEQEVVKSSNDQLLGTDIGLTMDYDFNSTRAGDLQLVSGTANMVQAVGIKMRTRPGGLPKHPTFGVGSSSGRKATSENILVYRAGVRNTMLADPRIADLQNMRISVEADILRLEAQLVLTGSPQPLAIDTRGS